MMDNLGAIHDRGLPSSRCALVSTISKFAKLVLVPVVVATVMVWHADIALGAAFTLQDGKRIEGEIIYASKSAVVVRKRSGALAQLGRHAIDRVELETDVRGVVAGILESWAEGVYEIKTEDKFFKVQGRRIIAERQINAKQQANAKQQVVPEIVVTAADEKEDAAKLVFKLGLSKPVKQEVLLIYSTEDGTALAGSDYEALRGNAILKPGATEVVVSVRLLDDDVAEGNETFELLVTSDLDLAAVKVKRVAATILDNEVPAAVRR